MRVAEPARPLVPAPPASLPLARIPRSRNTTPLTREQQRCSLRRGAAAPSIGKEQPVRRRGSAAPTAAEEAAAILLPPAATPLPADSRYPAPLQNRIRASIL